MGDAPASLVRPALAGLQAYEPGKPVEEVQRELGLARVVKLASNEGPHGPFPAALAALAATVPGLNRYPDGGSFRLTAGLAERHGVRFEEVIVGAGADGVLDCLSQAALDPGDEVVCGWPSFPSYVIYSLKQGAEVRRVPLVDDRYDLDGLLAAITPRTKLVYVCHPNNPTGTANARAELDDYFARVPDHVLTVLDQAYFEYVDRDDYPDGIAEYAGSGARVLVLRTFSKIFGLAGLRVGYGVGPAAVCAAIAKVRRPFDVSQDAQAAALASLDGHDELERRRAANSAGRVEVERLLAARGFRLASPAVANFVYAETSEADGRVLFERLLREGVIVRPLSGFGAPGAIRVTVGTPDEHAYLAAALERVTAAG